MISALLIQAEDEYTYAFYLAGKSLHVIQIFLMFLQYLKKIHSQHYTK